MCKSKGGRTKHTRSKHSSVDTGQVNKQTSVKIPSYITPEKALVAIQEIAKTLKDEKFYPKKEIALVSSLLPSACFVKDMNGLLHKFCRKNDRDKFMKEFFGKMYGSWREYFHPCSDQKAVFLMVVNLPERLIALAVDTCSDVDSELTVRSQFVFHLVYLNLKL